MHGKREELIEWLREEQKGKYGCFGRIDTPMLKSICEALGLWHGDNRRWLMSELSHWLAKQ
jgi:hypothetical protein